MFKDGWHNVLATHFNDFEEACGKYPGDDFIGVALPSTGAKWKYVEVKYRGKCVTAQVYDVGPWCIDDDDYVFGNKEPRARTCQGSYCPRILTDLVIVPDKYTLCNGAGIDLLPGCATALGIKINDNVFLDWRFP